MKKVILTTLMSVAAVAAFAQGTVTFKNDSSVLASPPDRLVRFDATAASVNAAYTAGTPVYSNANPNIVAQLFYGASTAPEGSLVAVTTAPTTFRTSTSTSVGVWFGGTRTLEGFATGTLNLQVRVWDSSSGGTFGNSVLQGKSTIFTYTIPTSTTPSPSDFFMANFTGFTIGAVPEPATFALAGLGAAALLIFRRRK